MYLSSIQFIANKQIDAKLRGQRFQSSQNAHNILRKRPVQLTNVLGTLPLIPTFLLALSLAILILCFDGMVVSV